MTTVERADALKEMGLFKGTDKGYELEVKPNRTQAIIFLIRMLGEENEALKSTYKCPFTDVPDWAKNYVGYAYAKGYTKGLNEKTFGANDLVSPAQFVTLMLRALGYNDSNGDFSWDKSVEKAEKLGIVNSGKYTAGMEFTRGDCVDIIYSFLQANKKDSDETLIKWLIRKGTVDQLTAGEYGLFYKIIRIPLKLKNGESFIYLEDVIKVVPGAKYGVFEWREAKRLYDYENAFTRGRYNDLVSPMNARYLEYFTKNYMCLNVYKDFSNKDIRLVTSIYDEKGNMLASSIVVARDAVEKGFIDFALVFVNGAETVAKWQNDFSKVFDAAIEYQDGIIAIEKAYVRGIVKNRKTGEIVKIMEPEETGNRPSYRFVFNTEKYPELEKAYYFTYGTVTGSKSVKETVREFCYRMYINDEDFKTDFGLNANLSYYLTELWKSQSEWNQKYYVILGDENRNLIGYMSIVPSSVKIIDVGIVEQVIYID